MEVKLKSMINIFTIIDGKINILLDKDDYIAFECYDEIDTANKEYIKNNINIKGLDLKQCYTFTEKEKDKLYISIVNVDIVNIDDIKLNKDQSLKEIKSLKENKYLDKSLDYLKNKLLLNSTIKKVYPNEFTLPELQKMYEELLGKTYDRRNFRKRLIKLDVILDLNKMSEPSKGRPAKLYKFKEINEDKILF